MARTVDVAVVGAGIAGLATARAISRSGRTVVVLEQFELGHARGSSHGATRIFRLSYPDERYVRMAQASLDGWRELEDESGETLLVQTGALDVGPEVAGIARALSACGVAFEEPTAGDLAERFGVRIAAGERALFQSDGGTTLADRALDAFHASARADGADVLHGTTVRELRVTPRRVDVVCDRETVVARAVVVAAGAWAPRLLPSAGIDLPVVPTRETIAYVQLPRAVELPSIIDYARIATPADGALFRSGVAGFALAAPGIGLKVGLHHAGPPTDPDDDPPPSEAIVSWAARWAEERIEGAGGVIGAETCLYTNTADESFVLERHGRVVVGSACSGHGFKFAPLIGRTLAALAAEAAG